MAVRQLGPCHEPRPAASSAARTGCREPSQGAFLDQVALELGQGGEDAEHQAPCRTGRVNPASQHLEADSLGAQRVHKFDHVAERPPNPIKFPDDQGIAGSHMVKRLGQPGAVSDGAAASVRVKPFAAGALQRITLKV